MKYAAGCRRLGPGGTAVLSRLMVRRWDGSISVEKEEER